MPDDRTTIPLAPGPLADAEVGEYLSIETPDEFGITDADDGGLLVDVPGEMPPGGSDPNEFYANLADVLSGPNKQRIVTELLRLVEQDKDAWEKRDDLYAEGIRRTGLSKDAPGGAEFEGASKAVHPMILEACVDYQSRIMKELYPPSGPVKPRILGKVTAEKEEKARRKTEFMNWQIRTEIKEARSVLETLFTQVPLGGSQFVRIWWDRRLERPRWEFAPIDKIKVPANAADFSSASRKTYIDVVSAIEFRQRVEQGMYLDLDLAAPSMMPEATKAQTASRKVEGVDDQSMNLDGDRELFEVAVHLEVSPETVEDLGEAAHEEAGKLYPYLVTIDSASRQMVAMYRNWEQDDPKREALEHLYEFPFIPWRGAFSIGFPHMIGSLSGAATGAMRALLDSALANTLPGGLILGGSGTSGQTVQPQIGSYQEIGTALETDDIRKKAMPFVMNPPSPVLFELLGFVVETARGVVRTSLDDTPSDSPSPVPVGTQLSRVEEGLVVFSAVHGRAHAAMTRLLAGQHRLNRLYLPDTVQIDDEGKEIFVRRSDFEGACDVQPVSEPTIYSDQQRFAQLNYIQSRSALLPQLWKLREIELMGLKLIKIADPERLLQDAPQPHELNAVNENLSMAMGQPVMVFPPQNHLAHIKVHMDFLQSPVLGSNPLIAPKFLMQALRHISEHMVYYYVSQTIATIENSAGMDPTAMMSTDPRVKEQFDALLALASGPAVAGVTQQMQGTMPILLQAQKMMQSMMPPPPMDPAQAALHAATQETQRRGAADQSKTAIDEKKLAIQADGNRIKEEDSERDSATKMAQTQIDSRTALEISAHRTALGLASGYTDGKSLSDGKSTK